MKFASALLALVAAGASTTAEASASASASAPSLRSSTAATVPHGASIPADAPLGRRLLSTARRRAENDQEEDVTWMVNYSLRFDSCHEIASVGGEGGGGGGAEGQEGQAGIQRLVKLRLCPTDSCSSSCRNGAEYVVQLREFLETYMQMKEEMEEAVCEQVEQTCEYECQNGGNNNNQNDNDERNLEDNYCMQQCFQEKGYGDCYEGDDNQNNNNNNNGQDFEIERFAECEPLNENQNNNNNNDYANSQMAYVGAYCSRGGSAINLGVFSDAACTVRSDNSLFEKYYYTSLPYATTSIVGRECLSCNAADYQYDDDDNNNNNNGNNNGNNNYNNYEISEMCQEVHERSAKCEKNLKIESSSASASYNGGYAKYYPHTESCQFIHSTLSSLESVTRSNGKSLKTARALAWVFGISTLGLIGYVVWQHRLKSERRNVDLSARGDLCSGLS